MGSTIHYVWESLSNGYYDWWTVWVMEISGNESSTKKQTRNHSKLSLSIRGNTPNEELKISIQ